jgi:hypothetical protein
MWYQPFVFPPIPLPFSLIELRLMLSRNTQVTIVYLDPRLWLGFCGKECKLRDWGPCEYQDCCYFVCCVGRWNTVYPAGCHRSRFSSVFEAGNSESYTRLRSYSSRSRVLFPSIPLVPGTHDYIRALPHCNSYQKIRDTQLRQTIARHRTGDAFIGSRPNRILRA